MARLEAILPPSPVPIDWNESIAFRWRVRYENGRRVGYMQAIKNFALLKFDDVQHADKQKKIIKQNTQQFIQGKPANNVLMTGARGTGKSSLIKACLEYFAQQGLRLVEIDKNDFVDLFDIVEILAPRPEKFILFCDDLSFEEGETGYKALKVALDGSVATQSNNILIYATSNRRHLLPERYSDNATYSRSEAGDLHPSETVEEKISLSERFGIWLSFYPFNQEEYLDIVSYWLSEFGVKGGLTEELRTEALQWALQRGSRSGRIAWQFAKDCAGKI